MGTPTDFLLRHFWPEGEPAFPEPPDHLPDASKAPTPEVRLRLFWEAYDRAREQGLPTLEVRYRLLRERYETLQRRRALAHWLRPHLRNVLILLLEALARGVLRAPFRSDRDSIVLEGLELSRAARQEQAEMAYLEPHVRKIPNAWYRDGQPPVFRVRQDRHATSLQYTFRFNGFPILTPHEQGVLLGFGVDWWEGLSRPLQLVVHLPAPPEAVDPREREQAIARALDRALAPLDPDEENLLKLITWELAVVAAARWHLTLGFDPPRDQPELFLNEEQKERRKVLLRNRKRVYKLLEEERRKLIPEGMKRLPSSETRRWVERVQQRLFEEAGLTLEELGLTADPRALSNVLSQGKRRTS